MIDGDYVQSDIGMISALLIVALTRLPQTDGNHEERTVLRCTLTLLEMLSRNVSKQMDGRMEGEINAKTN